MFARRNRKMKGLIRVAVGTASFLAFTFGVFLFGAGLGIEFGRQVVQREAVERGAGEWIIDSQTGVKTFAWSVSASRE
jgi:hypothetical protein